MGDEADLAGKVIRQGRAAGRAVFQIRQFGTAGDVPAAPVAAFAVNEIARCSLRIERMVGDIEGAFAAEIGSAVMLRRFGRRILARFAPDFAHFEERVRFERFGNEGFDFEIGQRQQLDRLLELGRHHQRLGLPDIEARPQRHELDPRDSGHHRVKLSPR